MKLTKFELEKMNVKEMSAIRAGSAGEMGISTCGADRSVCTGSDHCNSGMDQC